jgi:hypothetical protein
MTDITQSGLHQDSTISGQQFLVTQGLSGYTLVDRKIILFRLFLHPTNLARVNAVFARIRYSGVDIPDSEILIPYEDLIIENSVPNGPSVGIIFQGNIFPSALIRYFVEFYLLYSSGPTGRFAISNLKFQKSGTLRVLAKSIQSITGTAPWGNKIVSDHTWLTDLIASMERLGAMLPVSDGVFFGSNPGDDDGLAFFIGDNIDAWPFVCPLGSPPSVPDEEFPNILVCPPDEMRDFNLEEAKKWRNQGKRIDITVAWRLRDTTRFPPPGGEHCGGVGYFPKPPLNKTPLEKRYASVCGGNRDGVENTAPIMAQEIAHNFGVVTKESPHFDGHHHSKDPELVDPFAFDFVRLRPYSATPPGPGGSYLGDVMSYAWNQGRDLTLFNAYDWEHLRERLNELQIQALTNSDEKKGQKKLEEQIQTPFVGIQKVQVDDPEPTLNSKPGFEWHWTPKGFQLLTEGIIKRDSARLALSAESVLFTLRELGIKEAYAPIDGKYLSFIISPHRHASVGCEIDEIDSIDS